MDDNDKFKVPAPEPKPEPKPDPMPTPAAPDDTNHYKGGIPKPIKTS